MRKLFIIQKYVWASTAIEALLKEKDQQADEVFINSAWMNRPTTDDHKSFLDGPEETKEDKA